MKSSRFKLYSGQFQVNLFSLIPGQETMPIVKYPRTVDPLWYEWDRKAQKCGLRHTVYAVNGDRYTGEWLDNLKHGKGDPEQKKKKMGWRALAGLADIPYTVPWPPGVCSPAPDSHRYTPPEHGGLN